MRKRKKIKICSLCCTEIQGMTKYNVFKHNTLFRDIDFPHGLWECLYKHYICESCMEKLQAYCQKKSD